MYGMDDPVFDPWGSDEEEPPKQPVARPTRWTQSPRWRSTGGATPRGPTPPRTPSGSGLSGTAVALRALATSHLEEVARDLHLARHTASLEDVLEEPSARLRFTLRPWPGPWNEEGLAPVGRLELFLEVRPDLSVVARWWADVEADEPAEETRVAAAQASPLWLARVVAGFVEQVLARA